MPKTHRTRVGLAALVAVSGIAALQIASAGADPVPQSVEMRPQIDFPFASADQVDPEGYRLRWMAKEALVERCMEKAGLEYAPLTVPLNVPFRPYGVVDAEMASKRGYNVSKEVETSRAVLNAELKTFNARLAELGPDARSSFLNALNGGESRATASNPAIDPEFTVGGCSRAADDEIAGGDSRSFDRLESRIAEAAYSAAEATEADLRVVEVKRRWGQCMARQGYAEFTDPIDIAGAMMRASATRRISETALALADIACKGEVDLVSVMDTVRLEKETALSQGSMAVTVSEFRESLRSQATAARSVLDYNVRR